MSEAKIYTKEQADSSFAAKSHSHSNYISANNLATTLFTGFFANKNYFTCYISGPAPFSNGETLVAGLRDQQCTSFSTSLGCGGLLTNGNVSYPIIGLYLNNRGIVFNCQGPSRTIAISHPVEGGTRLSGRYNIGVFSAYRADQILGLQQNQAIPTSY